jgi:hypothetical protein
VTGRGGQVTAGPSASREAAFLPPVRALFQRRMEGDDALLRLARLRFTEAGLAAEVYADTPSQLEAVLRFAPPESRTPVVHLNRALNLLHERDRESVQEFARLFSGRVSGFVVHDQREMATKVQDLVAAMRDLDSRLAVRPDAPYVFLEYAAGLDPATFVEIAQLLRDADRVSVCIDIGHVGIEEARRSFAAWHRGLDVSRLTPQDARLPGLVVDVQAAVDLALPAVLEMTRAVGAVGKPVHFHLHDGHPIIPGLSDHFGFLTRVPIPFDHEGKRSLDPMYGPAGLDRIVSAVLQHCAAGRGSLTLEIHQAKGRLPLGDAVQLFRHWQDVTNAERMNYWLSMLAENSVLVSSVLRRRSAQAAGIEGGDPRD